MKYPDNEIKRNSLLRETPRDRENKSVSTNSTRKQNSTEKKTKKLIMASRSVGRSFGLVVLTDVRAQCTKHTHAHTQVDVSYSLDILIVCFLDCRCVVINFYQKHTHCAEVNLSSTKLMRHKQNLIRPFARI